MEREEQLPKILVVDDNPNNILVMTKTLESLPVKILSASCGKDALQLVLRHEFAVIYLDVQMPELGGYEVASCLSQNSSTAKIPIVLVTAIYNDLASIIKGYDSGAIDYLIKPIEPRVLIAKTRIFLELDEHKRNLTSMVRKLEELASIDALTGLANRNQFNHRFANVIRDSERKNKLFALLMMDLDNFKMINDVYGHDVGDQLLKKMSSRINSTVRGTDFVARLGGDEFAVLLSDINSPNDAGRVSKNIIENLSEPFQINTITLSVTISIGIATFPFGGRTLTDLYKASDVALYKAKGKGKKTFAYYTESLNIEHQRRSDIEKNLSYALENNEISLVYQPRINIKTNAIVCLEVLARWNSSSLGDVSPSEFIPIAEEIGLISDIGSCIIERAFMQLNKWSNEADNYDVAISINLSPFQLLKPDFHLVLKDFIVDHQVNVELVEFEITESVFSEQEADLEKTIAEISKLGFSLSIDDFGTGYSSLSRLKKLPISKIKIDKSFIHDLTEEPNDQAIIKAIIALANALQIQVVAEGVESKEQVSFLRQNNCLELQGFYFSKPLTATKVIALLNKERLAAKKKG